MGDSHIREIDYIISDIKRIQTESNKSRYDDRRIKKLLGERCLLHAIYQTLYGLGLDGDWGNPNSFYIEDHTIGNGIYDFRIYIINSYGQIVSINPIDSKNWADYSNKNESIVKRWMLNINTKVWIEGSSEEECIITMNDKNLPVLEVVDIPVAKIIRMNCQIDDNTTEEEIKEIVESESKQLTKIISHSINPRRPTEHERIRKDILLGMKENIIADKYNKSVGTIKNIKSAINKELECYKSLKFK